MSPVPKEERDKPVDDNPECNNVENDDSVPDFIITLTSSESEAESDADIEHDGYELLPQEAELIEFQPPIEAHETDPVTLLPNLHQPLPEEPCVLPFTLPDAPAEDAASLLWNQGNSAPRPEMDKEF
ncbi:unnamed protein product [Acanthosepion pharaonis]|uniref:Uncharacterized protein n=1 Tax=Acanthosepion pharaonis TaxID=158019 RepID=A0A812C2F6_ACAPH|nr:unnamed protein product [Sepia pharaonis]